MLLSGEDTVAKEGEACPPVRLARDSLGLGVDAFGGAVAVSKRERGDDGVAVPLPAPAEGVQVRRVGCAGLDDPEFKRASIFR